MTLITLKKIAIFLGSSFFLLLCGSITLHAHHFLEKFFSGGLDRSSFKLKKLLLPFYTFIDLWGQESYSTKNHSLLFSVLPYLYLGTVIFAMTLLPSGMKGICFFPDEGLLWFFFLLTVSNFLMIVMGRHAKSYEGIWGLSYIFLSFCCAGAILLSVILLVALWTGSMNMEKIVFDQKNLWFIVPLFPAFILYICFVLLVCRLNPFGIGNEEINIKGHYKSQYSGGQHTLLKVIEHLHLIVLLGLGVGLFLGGTLPLTSKIDWAPLTWFSIKVGFLLILVSWISSAFPNLKRDQVLRLFIRTIFPFAVFVFIFYVFMKTVFY